MALDVDPVRLFGARFAPLRRLRSTPWGALSHRLLGRGVRLTEADVQRQAQVLLPLAVSHTRALLLHAAALRA